MREKKTENQVGAGFSAVCLAEWGTLGVTYNLDDWEACNFEFAKLKEPLFGTEPGLSGDCWVAALTGVKIEPAANGGVKAAAFPLRPAFPDA